MRRLILASSEGDEAVFPMLLWRAAFKGRCKEWLGTHAEKVLAAMATCQNAKVKIALDSELRPILKKSVAQWAAEFVQHGNEASKLPKDKNRKKKQQRKQAFTTVTV